MRLRLLLLGVLLSLSLPTATALGAGVTVIHGSGSFAGTSDETNICGWSSTFVSDGQYHYTVLIDDAHHGQVNYEEVVNYTVTIHDDRPHHVRPCRGSDRRRCSMSCRSSWTSTLDRAARGAAIDGRRPGARAPA
jgi:hypothetical protein